MDMKKVLVNAQVTGATSFIELGMTVLHVILLKVYQGTNLYNLLEVMIVYDILLPYAFLMNTSHNKKRIVESGWNNVFKNIVGMANNSVENKENISKEISNPQKRGLEEKVRTKVTDTNEVNKLDSSHRDLAINVLDNGTVIKAQSHEISTTSSYPDIKKPDYDRLSLNVPLQDDRYMDVVRRQVSDMKSFETSEVLYLQYFRRLLKFHNARKNGVIISCADLEDGLPPRYRQYRTSKNHKRNEKNIKLKSSISSLDNRLYKEIGKFKFEDYEELCHTHVHLKGTVVERNVKRKRILQEIDISADNEQVCNALIERLIDLEEHFVKDNQT